MRIAIIKSINRVNIDGVPRTVALSGIPDNVHAVHWNGVTGHIEYTDETPQEALTDFSAYQSYVDAWTAAAPTPKTPAQILSRKRVELREAFKNETVVRMSAHVPAWDSFDHISFLMSIANLLNVGNMTANQLAAKDILLFVKNTALPRINAATDLATLNTMVPTDNNPFGDGTMWPN